MQEKIVISAILKLHLIAKILPYSEKPKIAGIGRRLLD